MSWRLIEVLSRVLPDECAHVTNRVTSNGVSQKRTTQRPWSEISSQQRGEKTCVKC
jgi:hypothetical protein